MAHPISGPITPEELQRIAELPFGKAGQELRKHDPAWGIATPENPNIKWDVTLIGMAPVSAVVEVEAPTEAEAKRAALALKPTRSDWDVDAYEDVEDIEVYSVAPA